jgi:hypothetical protein
MVNHGTNSQCRQQFKSGRSTCLACMVSVIIVPEKKHVMALLAPVWMGHDDVAGTGGSGTAAWAEGGIGREEERPKINSSINNYICATKEILLFIMIS